jgi:O-succinylbenzoic acid--CoA ligase
MVTRGALVGSALVLTGRFQAGAFAEMVRNGVVTHASLVPTMLRQYLSIRDEEPVPRTLRCLLIGGAHADADLVQDALDRGFPLALTYGMTEACSQVATAPPDLTAKKPGTVGSPLPGVEVRLSSEGEVWVRGETVAPGKRDEKGWFKTGDLARMDEDGDLWIIGRMTSRIISGGVNVDPAEVEALLRTHPGVAEAAVVGVPDPDWGERVVAAVATVSGGGLEKGELDRLSRAALSPAKRPRAFVLLSTLPRNANGKVDRERVRDLFR